MEWNDWGASVAGKIVHMMHTISKHILNKTIYPIDSFKCNKFLLESRFGDRGYYYNLRERAGCRLYNAMDEFRYIYL